MNENVEKFNQTQENLIDVIFNLTEEFNEMTYEEIREYTDIVDKLSSIIKRLGETIVLNGENIVEPIKEEGELINAN